MTKKHQRGEPESQVAVSDYRVSRATHRDIMQASEIRGWDHFDDVVFKIAAGGLAVSVTFIGVMKGAPKGQALSMMPWMFAAWICWASSLALLLLSVCAAQGSLREQIDRWDNGTYYDTSHPEGHVGRAIIWMNRGAAYVTIFGLACLIVFAVGNLVGG